MGLVTKATRPPSRHHQPYGRCRRAGHRQHHPAGASGEPATRVHLGRRMRHAVWAKGDRATLKALVVQPRGENVRGARQVGCVYVIARNVARALSDVERLIAADLSDQLNILGPLFRLVTCSTDQTTKSRMNLAARSDCFELNLPPAASKAS